MNDQEAVHQSSDLTDDNNSNIKEHETQHKKINWNISFYTIVENQIQSSHQLEDQN